MRGKKNEGKKKDEKKKKMRKKKLVSGSDVQDQMCN